MNKKKQMTAMQAEMHIDEAALFQRISEIIENRKIRAGAYTNREIALMYWEVGIHINSVILDGGRAAYGKNILSTLSTKLMTVYGDSFYVENIYRMMRFAKVFSDFEILSTASTKLSWSHFCEIMRVKTEEGQLFYVNDAVERNLGVHALRQEISRKAFERREIESFILEFGHGLSFVARQKRMSMDGVDFKLDLLFYSRELRRLIAIELKLGMFKPEYKGQMEFYLKWLNRFERYESENTPIGLILCAKAHRGQIELLEMDKSGIAVSEYWTMLPPKVEFERKIQEILLEARERLERRKTLTSREVIRQIDYFIEPKDDDEE